MHLQSASFAQRSERRFDRLERVYRASTAVDEHPDNLWEKVANRAYQNEAIVDSTIPLPAFGNYGY